MSSKLEKALQLIDAAHADDPNKTTVDGKEVPYELHYANKMTQYLKKRQPDASEVLQIAIRAQHLRRWEVPRSSYPMTKPGYYSWRTFLKKRQAEIAKEMCISAGFTEEDAGRVAALIRKEDLKVDAETQALEDVACLVFIDDQFEDFEKNHDEDKIISIVRKTWGKMSPKGQEMALAMDLQGRTGELINKALS